MKIKKSSFGKHGFCLLAAVSWEASSRCLVTGASQRGLSPARPQLPGGLRHPVCIAPPGEVRTCTQRSRAPTAGPCPKDSLPEKSARTCRLVSGAESVSELPGVLPDAGKPCLPFPSCSQTGAPGSEAGGAAGGCLQRERDCKETSLAWGAVAAGSTEQG